MALLFSISQLNGAKMYSANWFFLVPFGLRISAQRAGESVSALKVEIQRATHMVTEN